MNAREAEALLLDLELFGMRFGLDRMHKLTTALGMPQRSFASIHVVGTNGKSSTTRFTAAILEREGLRTGSFTSPHLRSFAERIEVGEKPLSDEEFAAAVARAWHAAELVNRTLRDGEQITQFELLTAAAYSELARRGVEVAVVEAGLGGRFDATNVIPSSVQVLTSVGLDHTRWLGPSLRDVAMEKLAVVRDHARLVLPGDLGPDAEEAASMVAAERHSLVVRAESETGLGLRARGSFQRRNFALAEAAASAFLDRPPSAEAVRSAASETVVPGRLEVVSQDPLTLFDGAHNAPGAAALSLSLPEVLEGRPLTLVVSVLDDKDAAAILGTLAPHAERALLTRCSSPRALSPATLESLAAKLHHPLPAEVVGNPREALVRAREAAGPGGAVLATGSIYLIADLVRDPAVPRASAI